MINTQTITLLDAVVLSQGDLIEALLATSEPSRQAVVHLLAAGNAFQALYEHMEKYDLHHPPVTTPGSPLLADICEVPPFPKLIITSH